MLDEGRLVEQGSHDELLALGGHYAELERLQSLSSETEDGEDEPVAGEPPQLVATSGGNA